MLRSSQLFLLMAVLLSFAACSPSESAVQTAVAQTETARPTATNTSIPTTTPSPSRMPSLTPEPTETPLPTSTATPTLVPISELNIESVLIQEGDLPGGMEPGQVSDQLESRNVTFRGVKEPEQVFHQYFADDSEFGHGGAVIVYLYEEESDVENALRQIVAKMEEDVAASTELVPESPTFDLEAGEDSYAYDPLLGQTHAIFSRCHALVYIWMVEGDYSEIGAYARRLDTRLEDVVCRR